MRIRISLAAVALVCLCVRPALAAPRVTLKQENLSLHELFLKLRQQTGLQFRSQDGAGEDGFREPAASKRVKVDWKNAPLGKVLRELCNSFGLTASAMGDGGYWFRPGLLPKRTEVTAEGEAFSIGYVSQGESLTLTSGQPKARMQRTVSMRLVCRAESGEGDILGPITKLKLIDEHGKAYEPQVPGASDLWYGMPDERVKNIYFPWTGEHARKLQRIEGEMTLFERADEYHFALPLPSAELPPNQQQAGVRLKVQKLNLVERRVDARLRLEWPGTTEIAATGPSGVRVLLKFPNNRTERLWGGSTTGTAEDGTRYLQLDFSVQYDAVPNAMEIQVPARTGTGRRVAFHMDNVLMPFGKPQQLRLAPQNLKPKPPLVAKGRPHNVPDVFYDTDGGTLQLPPVPKKTDEGSVEMQVGLSRQNANGSWTAPRWIQLPGGPDPLRLDGLAAGRYRVRVTYWQRLPEKPLQRLPIPEKVAVIDVRKGQEVKL